MNKTEEIFHQLVRLGIGTSKRVFSLDAIDLRDLENLAERQGVSAILADALQQESSDRIKSASSLEWIHNTLQGCEVKFGILCRVLEERIKKNEEKGAKTVILNPFFLEWPRPEFCPGDDIFMWIRGEQKSSFATLVYKDHRKKNNVCDYIYLRFIKDRKWMKIVFEECPEEKYNDEDFNGQKIYVPSHNFVGLFLMFHSLHLFYSSGIKLRHLLDWAFFVKRHGADVDWDWLHAVLEKYHMREFYDCFNAICVEDLGFDSKIFPYVQFEPKMKENVLNAILYPSPLTEGSCFFRRCFSILRQRSNSAWKRQLFHR